MDTRSTSNLKLPTALRTTRTTASWQSRPSGPRGQARRQNRRRLRQPHDQAVPRRRHRQHGRLHLEHPGLRRRERRPGRRAPASTRPSRRSSAPTNGSRTEPVPDMTDGTAGTRRPARAGGPGRQPGQLPARPARHSKASSRTTSTSCTARATPCSATSSTRQPVYVKAPFADYQDTGYAAFKAANAEPHADGVRAAQRRHAARLRPRQPTSRAARRPGRSSRDGDAACYRLADTNYAQQARVLRRRHAGDRRHLSTGARVHWKTILVGGLERRRQGLLRARRHRPGDTRRRCGSSANRHPPAAPGRRRLPPRLSFGNPVITKLADGTWVVLVTSGYNNVNTPATAATARATSTCSTR